MSFPTDMHKNADTAASGAQTGAAEDHWKRLTHLGNEAFHQGDMPLALDYYQQARDHAVRHFADWRTEDDATAALVVSCFNLSEAWLRTDRREDAAGILCQIHGHLLMTAHNPFSPEARRVAAQQHLRETLGALARFEQTHGPAGDISAAMRLTFELGPMFHKAGISIH